VSCRTYALGLGGPTSHRTPHDSILRFEAASGYAKGPLISALTLVRGPFGWSG
jgi:hypothetical protein